MYTKTRRRFTVHRVISWEYICWWGVKSLMVGNLHQTQFIKNGAGYIPGRSHICLFLVSDMPEKIKLLLTRISVSRLNWSKINIRYPTLFIFISYFLLLKRKITSCLHFKFIPLKKKLIVLHWKWFFSWFFNECLLCCLFSTSKPRFQPYRPYFFPFGLF